MTPAKVRPIKQPMHQMSWTEVRQALDEHQQALTQLFGNCEALKGAIEGEIVDGKLVSRALADCKAIQPPGVGWEWDHHTDTITTHHTRLLSRRIDQFAGLSFWGRLRWLLTGRI